MICLLSLSVFGIDVYEFDKCTDLTVNVTGLEVIDLGEYWFNDCYEVSTDTWACNCTDGYILVMDHKINTINTYNITMVYSYSKDVSSGSSGGGSHRNRVIVHDIITHEKQPLIDYRTIYNTSKPVFVDNLDDTIKLKGEINQTEDEVMINEIFPEQDKPFNWLLWGLVGVAIIIIIGIIIYLKKISEY